MSAFSNPKDYYGLPSGEMGIPEMLVSSPEQMMPPSTTTIKSVPTQSGDATSGGIQMFQISTGSGNGYVKPGSLYLRCQITVDQVAAADTTWKFSSAGSASSIINRLNVSCGGVMINSCNNYNVVHDAILNHATNISFVQNDSVLYEETGVVHTNAAANVNVYVSIPIISPLFNNEQAVPLFLLNSPIVLEILYNSTIPSFTSANDGADPPAAVGSLVTGFTVKGAKLVYETLNVSPELEASIRAKLAAGSVYTTYLDDNYNLQVSSSSALNYTMGLGLSSVKSILWTNILTTNFQATQWEKKYVPNGIYNMRVFLDGRQINLDTLDTQSNIYCEMQRALQNLWVYTTTSNNGGTPGALAAGAARGTYANSTFLGGVNCNRCNDSGFAFTGSPCQNLNFILESGVADTNKFPGNVNYAGATTYVMILYSQRLTIDVNGMISLVR